MYGMLFFFFFFFDNVVMVYDATKPCSYKAPKMHYNIIIINKGQSEFEQNNLKCTLF